MDSVKLMLQELIFIFSFILSRANTTTKYLYCNLLMQNMSVVFSSVWLECYVLYVPLYISCPTPTDCFGPADMHSSLK